MKYAGITSDKDAAPEDEERGYRYEALATPAHLYGRGDTPQDALDCLRGVFKSTGVKLCADQKVVIWRRWNDPDGVSTNGGPQTQDNSVVVEKRTLRGYTTVEDGVA